MKKVIDIKEIKEQDKLLGPYTRRKCLVKYMENGKTKEEICYLDEEAVIDKIYSYIDYLNSLKDKGIKAKRSLTSAERKENNMEATKFYAIGVVLVLASLFGSETIAIPMFIGGSIVLLATALVANDLLFYRRIEEDKDVLNIEDMINEAKDLEKEVQYEMSRKENMKFARYKIEKMAKTRKQEIIDKASIRKAIDDLRFKAVREAWERGKRPLPSMEKDNYHELSTVVVRGR